MWGRFGSMLTVCASPMWLVIPIVSGLAGSVTSRISSPPSGAPTRPKSPWSWQRPGASLASMSSWVSWRAAARTSVLRIALPFGVASTSCWSPSEADGSLTHEAVGALETNSRPTSSPSASLKIDCPPPLPPVPSVPSDT
jgi:hypothetical protein